MAFSFLSRHAKKISGGNGSKIERSYYDPNESRSRLRRGQKKKAENQRSPSISNFSLKGFFWCWWGLDYLMICKSRFSSVILNLHGTDSEAYIKIFIFDIGASNCEHITSTYIYLSPTSACFWIPQLSMNTRCLAR